ncbi:MAG: WG repeat-containing protein, partial [Flavobacterium sp.]
YDENELTCLRGFDEDSYKGFAVFGIKGENDWFAIDSNEKKLFKVYNTSFGEPSPDKLIENKIRIVDDNGKIGFADSNGKIIIKPQFEIVTSFHKGKAIIGETCTKIPWNQHATEVDCHHYTIECKKQGYIDQNGTILEIGNFTFEEIQKKIKWKSELY